MSSIYGRRLALVLAVGALGLLRAAPAEAAECTIGCLEPDGSAGTPFLVAVDDCASCERIAQLQCHFGVSTLACLAPVSGSTPPGYMCGDPQFTMNSFTTAPASACGDFCYDVKNRGDCPAYLRCYYGDAGRGNPINVFHVVAPGKTERVCCPNRAPGRPANPLQGLFGSCPAHVEDDCTFDFSSIPANECPQAKGPARVGAGRVLVTSAEQSTHCTHPGCTCSVGATGGVCADYICEAITGAGRKGVRAEILTRCLCTAAETTPNTIALGNFHCSR